MAGFANNMYISAIVNSIDREKQTIHLYAQGGLGSFISPNFKYTYEIGRIM